MGLLDSISYNLCSCSNYYLYGSTLFIITLLLIMKYEQQIDRFLLGQMSSEEESLFIQECKQNSELKKEAVMTALLVKALKQTK